MKHSSHHLSFNKIASSVVFVFVALGISFYFLGNQNSLLTQVSGTGTITTVTTKPALLNFESSLPIAPAPAFARSCANATTFARTTLSPKAGNYSFKFSGTDDCGTANSFVYYKIADANLPITENTVLEYKIAPQNTFGQNVGVDLLLDNGQYLRDQEIYSDDTVLAHPAYQSKHSSFVSCCPLPTLATIKVNLGKLRGRTIKQIIIGYDDASNTQQGPFDARIDDIKIYDVASFRKFPLGQKVALSRDRYLSKNLHTTELVTPKQIVGATGVIIDGPIGQSPYVRWKVDFDNTTTDGWAYESDLQGPFTESQVSAVASASTNSCNNNIKGDMDCSGPIKEAVTVTDGVVVLRCAAGLSPCNTTLIDSDIIKQGDMDCDGKITVTDGVNVLRKAAGLSVPGCYQPILEIGRLETGKVLSSIIWKT
ncbi:MAG: hypothetical protein Q8L47_04750, partial [bacterium]|nr:hypothetical protein [bacterium]